MYADASQKLDEILALVAKCPDPLKEKCFELVLKAYLDSKVVSPAPAPSPHAAPSVGHQAPTTTPAVASGTTEPAALPESLKPRFAATAGRIGVTVQQLGGLFDFQLDPYNYHALNVPGITKADKMRNVGLLLCAKSYLMMGGWSADGKEFRAVCLDHNCWDRANAGANLATREFFKDASTADGLTLSSKGVEAAQALLAQLIQGTNATVK